MTLTAREARVIRALADHRRLSSAAEALHVSQSSLSRTLAGAESRLGVALFQRGWTGAEPTAAGDLVVGLCQRILSDLEQVAAASPRLATHVQWHHLTAVAAVVATGSATGAARLLGLRQPAISQALADLAAFSAPVFTRRSTGLEATDTARALAALWQRIEADLAALPALLARPLPGLTGRLAVGLLPFSGQRQVMAAFGELARAHPHLRLIAVPGNYAALCDALRRREIDVIVGLLRNPAPWPGFVETPLGAEDFTLVARADHPVHGAGLTIDTLAAQRWIAAPHGTPLRRYFETVFRRLGAVPPAQSYEIWSFSDAEQMIADSDSVALLSYSPAALTQLRPDLKRVDFPLPDARTDVGLTRLAETANPAIEALAGLLRARLT